MMDSVVRSWVELVTLSVMQGTLIVGAALLALRVFARQSAARRHTVILVALLGLLLVPGGLWLAQLRSAEQPGSATQMAAGNKGAVVSDGTVSLDLQQSAEEAPTTPLSISPRLSVQVTRFSWLRALFLLWCAGVFVQFMRLGAGVLAVRRVRKRSLPAYGDLASRIGLEIGEVNKRRIFLSPAVGAPVTMGFLRARVVLPPDLVRQLSDTELRAVLLHELAHIERRDTWACSLQRIAEIFLYHHPLVWWLGRRLNVERERACDERVVARMHAPREYARALLRVATLTQSAPRFLLASSAPGAGLASRIEQLLRPARLLSVRVRALALIAAALLTAAAATTPRVALEAARLGNAALPGDPGTGTGSIGERIDATLQTYVPHGFSGVVLVAQGDRIVLHKAYGLADRERNIAMTTGTYFSTAGMTKAVTAAGVLLLEQDGRLSTADRLARYIGALPGAKNDVTLHDLLTHTDGLTRAGAELAGSSRDAFVSSVKETPIAYAPGTATRYTDIGYSLLGVVIEQASGESYESFIRKRVFAPAGMTASRFENEALPAGATLAVEYTGPVGDQHRVAPRAYQWGRRASLGLVTTAEDLFRLLRASEAGFGYDVRRKLFTPQNTSNYGTQLAYGWDVSGSKGELLHRRLAGTPGLEGELLNNLEQGWSAVILVNSAVGWRYAVWDEIAAAFNKLPPTGLEFILSRRRYAPYQGGPVAPVRSLVMTR